MTADRAGVTNRTLLAPADGGLRLHGSSGLDAANQPATQFPTQAQGAGQGAWVVGNQAPALTSLVYPGFFVGVIPDQVVDLFDFVLLEHMLHQQRGEQSGRHDAAERRPG